MEARFPFNHPEIEAVLRRQHDLATADKWKLIPRLPRYLLAKLTGRLDDESFRRGVFFDVYSAVTPERGAVLYLLARAIGAKRIVEFGSSFGISTIYLATAVLDNFAGEPNGAPHVVGSEMDTRKIAAATKNIEDAGLGGLVKILPGDALETLGEVEGPIDFAFLDGGKHLYLPVLKLLEAKLRPGAMIVADNIDSFRSDVGPYLEYVQSAKNSFASSTLGLSDGMKISIYEGK